MSDIEVLVFSSHRVMYGVMASQVARLSQHSDDLGAETVDLVHTVEGHVITSGYIPNQQASVPDRPQYMIFGRGDLRYRIPGPVELRAVALDCFRLIPAAICRFCSSKALRAVFFLDDRIGFLIDLSRVRSSIPGESTDAIHRRMV